MNDVVEAARELIGTPYHHQGRVKGVGVDCIGVTILAGKAAGRIAQSYNVTGYRRLPDGHSLMANLREQCTEIKQHEMLPGDIVCIAYDRHPHHVGVLGDYPHGGLSMIHADSKIGKVVETRLMFTDDMRFVAAFRLPGVA